MNTQTEKCPGGVRPPTGAELIPERRPNVTDYRPSTHPRWCSPWTCIVLDDTVIHRSEPRTVQTSDGRITVGWFRIDVDNIPGTVRLEVLPNPPTKQVAA